MQVVHGTKQLIDGERELPVTQSEWLGVGAHILVPLDLQHLVQTVIHELHDKIQFLEVVNCRVWCKGIDESDDVRMVDRCQSEDFSRCFRVSPEK